MESFHFGRRSLNNLIWVHPNMVLGVSRMLLYCPIDFAVTQGLRDHAEQLRLMRAGKSWTERSKHLRQSDGYCHAIDLMAVGDLNRDGVIDVTDRSLAWNREWYGQMNVAAKRAFGELQIRYRWGGDWDCDGDTGDERNFDGPHFELVFP